jgi:hypothetical protein
MEARMCACMCVGVMQGRRGCVMVALAAAVVVVGGMGTGNGERGGGREGGRGGSRFNTRGPAVLEKCLQELTSLPLNSKK